MNAVELLQFAVSLSQMARKAMSLVPQDQLTPEQKDAIEAERIALNDDWADLAPRDEG